MNYTKSRISLRVAFLLLISAGIVSCDPGSPSGSTGFTATGDSAALTQAEFNNLPPEQQYQVANKLYGAFFRGISVEEFFDMSAGMQNLTPKNPNFLDDTRAKLSRSLTVDERNTYDRAIDGLDEDMRNPDESLARYSFDDRTDLENNHRPREIPLARIKDYPISRDLYVNWMAYFLANTVMYSPAEEMESTDMLDVQRMFRFLFSNIEDRATIRQMVSSNIGSLSRWRVSRTPQNHALEAFENYLGLFQKGNLSDEEKIQFPVLASLPQSIENAGIACRDLFLTRASDDYLIGQTDFPNTTPLLILEESFVTDCGDVYAAVSGHSLLIPRAVEVIINYFIPGLNAAEQRLAVRQAIINSNPETYEDIFTAIIFSREYLLSVHRPKSFEENFLPLLDSLQWDIKANVSRLNKGMFEDMATREGRTTYLGGMGWDAMRLKIGRFPNVPLDALSFANYHKAMRETLLTDSRSYMGGSSDAGDGLIFTIDDDLKLSVGAMSLEEYIDYLFLSTLHRRATAAELTALIDYLVNVRDYTDTDTDTVLNVDFEVIKSFRYDETAEEVFDYISRLPELYYFTSIGQQ